MIQVTPERLASAVTAVCSEIVERIDRNPHDHTERSLWWELSSCLLSSQVPYSLATAAADRIQTSELLTHWNGSEELLANDLMNLLSTPMCLAGRLRTYRFPRSRGNQLAATRAAVAREAGGLDRLLAGFTCAAQARDWFVRSAPGIGPKQASMFLRNSGVSYDLAVLDRHVMTYMSTVGLTPERVRSVVGMEQYQRHEATLRAHAVHLGYPVGLLDWAIWIVMRVAQGAHTERVAA